MCCHLSNIRSHSEGNRNVIWMTYSRMSSKPFFLFLFQVARQLQPSVVYIGDAERTFVKKVPKTDKVSGPFWVSPSEMNSESALTPSANIAIMKSEIKKTTKYIVSSKKEKIVLLYKNRWNTRWDFARKTWYLHTWKDHRYVINRAFGLQQKYEMVWYFTAVYVINRTLHHCLEIRNFSSRVEKYFTSECKYFSTRIQVWLWVGVFSRLAAACCLNRICSKLDY